MDPELQKLVEQMVAGGVGDDKIREFLATHQPVMSPEEQRANLLKSGSTPRADEIAQQGNMWYTPPGQHEMGYGEMAGKVAKGAWDTAKRIPGVLWDANKQPLGIGGEIVKNLPSLPGQVEQAGEDIGSGNPERMGAGAVNAAGLAAQGEGVGTMLRGTGTAALGAANSVVRNASGAIDRNPALAVVADSTPFIGRARQAARQTGALERQAAASEARLALEQERSKPAPIPGVVAGPKPTPAPNIVKGMSESGKSAATDARLIEGMSQPKTTTPFMEKRSYQMDPQGEAADIAAELAARRAHGTAGFKQLPELPPGELQRIMSNIDAILAKRNQP